MIQSLEMKWSWVEGSHGMRTELMDSLTDADLAFTPGGTAMTLGALCREMGDIEHSYAQSFKTFNQDWSVKNAETGIETSVAKLKAWYQKLDDDLLAALNAISDADSQKQVDRGGGNTMPLDLQLDVYLQALLIFFGKASIYLRTMNKPLPPNIKDWIW